ncbi:MAG: GumN family protein [Caulobacteraceae bacterium]|nr:GumN family protein [Caulobacteraceae bacterium]
MKRLFVLLLLLILGGAPAFSAPANRPGPVWWKVSDRAGSVLWILAIPDGMMMDAKWDEASLRRRLAVARLLVSPLLDKPVIERFRPRPWEYAISTVPGAVRNQDLPIGRLYYLSLKRPILAVTFDDPLSSRLPPAMMERTRKALSVLHGNDLTELLNGKTWETALWLDLWNWPKGLLGNPITRRAQVLAKVQKLPVRSVQVGALWKPILVDNKAAQPESELYHDFDSLYDIRSNMRYEPPEAVQQKCLDQVLTQTESRQMPAIRRAAMEAWARGDLQNALRRSNNVQLCLLGDQPSTGVAEFERDQAQLYLTQLDAAFTEKGETVALVEFDPLLLESGGVLDHYRRLGFEITMGNGLE